MNINSVYQSHSLTNWATLTKRTKIVAQALVGNKDYQPQTWKKTTKKKIFVGIEQRPRRITDETFGFSSIERRTDDEELTTKNWQRRNDVTFRSPTWRSIRVLSVTKYTGSLRRTTHPGLFRDDLSGFLPWRHIRVFSRRTTFPGSFWDDTSGIFRRRTNTKFPV